MTLSADPAMTDGSTSKQPLFPESEQRQTGEGRAADPSAMRSSPTLSQSSICMCTRNSTSRSRVSPVDLGDEAPVQDAHVAVEGDDEVAGVRVRVHEPRVQQLDEVAVEQRAADLPDVRPGTLAELLPVDPGSSTSKGGGGGI